MDEKMKELSQVLPSEIEARSFGDYRPEELGGRTFRRKKAGVKRVIHTTADFEYADSLVFSPGAVDKALEALKNGACIVTDTNMGKSGINKRALASLGDGLLFYGGRGCREESGSVQDHPCGCQHGQGSEQKWEKTVYFLQLGMHRPTLVCLYC